MRLRLLIVLALVVWLQGCAEQEPASRRFCRALLVGGAPPASLAALAQILAEVREGLYPELQGVSVGLEAMESSTDFFVANLDLSTLDDPPLERSYLIRYSDRLLADPPGRGATAAILAHELKHVVDYTEMSGEELARFALWYVTADISSYERATDEHVLELGCGAALKLYRLWLYQHVDAQTLEQKKKDYYTPEEIDAWIAEHG